MNNSRLSLQKTGLILLILQLCTSQSFSQQVYFIDGFHGGVYGHYPKQYTKFITQTLDKNPNWKINLEIEPETWDTVQVNEPANYAAFKKYFNDDQSVNSRVEYVNPAYGQSYFFNINGESIIRQFQYGIKKIKQHFPHAVFTSYSSEEPCFTSALPQILASLGFKYASLKNPNTCWGGYTRAFGGELVNWIGPDGTKLITVPRYEVETFEPYSTWQTTASNNSKTYLAAAFKYGIASPVGMCLQDAGWSNGPWLGNTQQIYPTMYTTWRNYIQNIAVKNRAKDWHFSQEDVQVSLVWGAQVMQQIAKQVRRSENKIGRAEKLAAMANLYSGIAYPANAFDEAWRCLLLAQHHDCWIVPYNGKPGNTWIDKVGAWTTATDSVSNDAMKKSILALCNNTKGNEACIRVFNTSANARKEPVAFTLPPGWDGGSASLLDQHGQVVRTQLLQKDGGRSLLFMTDAPSMGYTSYKLVRAKPAVKKAGHISQLKDGTYIMESDLYRITIDPVKGGRVKSIIAKTMNNKEFVDTADTNGFNELRGYFVKDSSFFSSNDAAATITIEEDGPLHSSLNIEGKINDHSFTQTISISDGSPVVDMKLTINWKGSPVIGAAYKQAGGYRNEDYRKAFYSDSEKLQTLFPLNLKHQQVYKDAPFDVTKSRLQNTFFQTWDSIKNNILLNWVDITDGAGKYGVALFSDHTTSYAHGENFPLALTTQYSGVGLWGRQYTLTKPTVLHYAIVPHKGLWNKSGLCTLNNNWNNPLSATVFQPGKQSVEYTKSLVSYTGHGLEITAVVIDGDDLVVRFFNAADLPIAPKIIFDGKAKKIITEELSGQIKQLLTGRVTGKKTTVNIAFPAFGIHTIRLINFTAN